MIVLIYFLFVLMKVEDDLRTCCMLARYGKLAIDYDDDPIPRLSGEGFARVQAQGVNTAGGG